MSGSKTILDYRPPERAAPRKLTLEEVDGCVRVLFAVLPAWLPILGIVAQLIIGVAYFAASVSVFVAVSRLFHTFARLTPEMLATEHRFLWQTSLSFLIGGLFWSAFGGYAWWMHRRWGRVPRVLTANAEGLINSRLGWWRMRERRWSVNEITGIEFRPVKRNLNWKRTVADLYIHRRDRRRLHFRLSSSDPQLPALIARRVASALGCPVR